MRLFKFKSSSLSSILSWRSSGQHPIDAFPPETEANSDIQADLSGTSSPSRREQSDGWSRNERVSESTPAKGAKSEHRVWKTWSRERLCRLRHSMTGSARRGDVTNSRSDVTGTVDGPSSVLVLRSRSVRSLFYRRKSKRQKQELNGGGDVITGEMIERQVTAEQQQQQQEPSATPIRKFPYAFIKSNCNRRRVPTLDTDSAISPRSGPPADLLLPAPCGFQDEDSESRRESAEESGVNRTVGASPESNPNFSDSGNDSIDSEPGYCNDMITAGSWARNGPVRRETDNSLVVDTPQLKYQATNIMLSNNSKDVNDSGCEAEAGIDVSRLMSTSSPILRPRRRHHGRRANHALILQDFEATTIHSKYPRLVHMESQNQAENSCLNQPLLTNHQKMMHNTTSDSLHLNSSGATSDTRCFTVAATHQKKKLISQHLHSAISTRTTPANHYERTKTRPTTTTIGNNVSHRSRFGDTGQFLITSAVISAGNLSDAQSSTETAERLDNGREYMNIASLNVTKRG